MPLSKEEMIAKIEAMDMVTLVGDGQKVYACVESSPRPGEFHINLNTKEKRCGYIEIILEERELPHPCDKRKPYAPHLYIVVMNNLSGLKHVGNALHELAFRLSVAAGFQGRIRLNAIESSHLFHCLNGFIVEFDDEDYGSYYYMKLMVAVIQSNGQRLDKDLGSEDLYLPKKHILKNLTKFGLSLDEATIAESEEIPSAVELANIDFSEKILKQWRDGLSKPQLPAVLPSQKRVSLVPLLGQGYLTFGVASAANDRYQSQASVESVAHAPKASTQG